MQIAEEAVHNVRQDAEPSEIEILLMWDHGRVRRLLRDDGMGLPAEVLARGGRAERDGLRARAERIGGGLS
ncbi:nitrate/nitrite-specific signal transduction histidine kinase [Sphingomonas trueperi]|uniref:hypothetical protein n=1 Tax=Sphingomonas trueperi TaxID=53317 RepID=UPI00339AA05C